MTISALLPAAPPVEYNFADHLLTANAGRAGKTAFIDDDRIASYGDVSGQVRRTAAALAALGLQAEDRVLLLMHDCIDWPVAFLGCLYAGVVPVCVNTLLTAGDYAYMLTHSRSRLAFVSQALVPMLREAMSMQPNSVRQLIVSHASGEQPEDAVSMDALLARSPPRAGPAPTLADEPAFWLYSSGSTGRPKGTVHTHGNLYWTAELYGKAVLGMNEQDVVFSAAKLFFAYGLGNGLTFPMSVGATAVLMAGRPTPDACFERMVKYQPTIFCGAPTGYAGMLQSPGLPARSTVALRMCSSAGEALPREIGERFTEHFGCHIIDGIGSTEMLHVFLSNAPGDVRYGTTGKPVPGYDLELRGEDGRMVADGEIGDLFIRGPSAALMYWNNREKTRDTFQGHWTRSGDKYTRDTDGYYTYAGRSDDMLKVSGQYVSPFEVEGTLVQHPAVFEAAVIGVDDGQGLVKTLAYVVLKASFEPSIELDAELKGFVKARLAPHKYPRQIVFLDELPKTATGKIQRFRLREQASADVRQAMADKLSAQVGAQIDAQIASQAGAPTDGPLGQGRTGVAA
ncbi:MAG: benzoate-CoA ligase family protein [Rhizobacter sp.]|nr:benzoate-CoA ligase family protein [Rhizobacter sp.]